MKVVYDPKTDTLTVRFKPGPVAESDESKPGVILDYDEQGNLLGLEILDASQRVDQAQAVQFEVGAA
jgi:uncharacterized protein YuzE